MRIALFSESFAPVVNGVSVSIDTLGDELQRRGHTVFFFAPHCPGYTDENPNVFRLPSIRAPGVPDYPLALGAGRRLFRQFQELNVDIVHTHTPFMVGLAGLRWARRLRIPLISTNHTHYTEYVHYIRWVPRPLMKSIAVGWMRWYYSRCDTIIVPSAATGKRLQGYGVKVSWTAIPTGICLPEGGTTQLDLRKEHSINPDDRLLLFVGRIAREKNLLMLLDAFAMINKAEPDSRLVIVGGGPFLDEYRREIKNVGLEGRVTLTGPVPRESLPDVFSQCELFVFPSLTETQGLAVGEAATYGLPAVVVNSGGTPEFVRDGKTGYLVENSPQQFAERVLELLHDPEKRAVFSEQAKSFGATLTVDVMVDRILQVYSTAKAGSPASCAPAI